MNAWNQFFWLPVTAFIYGLDFMVRTLQAVQQTAQQIANPYAGPLPPAGGGLDRSTPVGGTLGGGATTNPKETGEMSQDCCRDQCGTVSCEVKIYEYYIVLVKPDDERVIVGPRSILVDADMNGEAFTSYAIALYFQEEGHEELDHRDKKYLRVCYRVACTFRKERPTYAKDQVQVLREIRDALGGGA